jgi:hypothetical protein
MNEDRVISVVVIKESGATYVETNHSFNEDVIYNIRMWMNGFSWNGDNWIKGEDKVEDT